MTYRLQEESEKEFELKNIVEREPPNQPFLVKPIHFKALKNKILAEDIIRFRKENKKKEFKYNLLFLLSFLPLIGKYFEKQLFLKPKNIKR